MIHAEGLTTSAPYLSRCGQSSASARAIALFIERDLGTERGEVLAEKIRRYRSVLSRTPDLAVHVGFVVGSHRRSRTVHALARRAGSTAPGVLVVTATEDEILADPLGARWSDGRSSWPTRELPPIADPVLLPGPLADPDSLAAVDNRASATLPAPLTPGRKPAPEMPVSSTNLIRSNASSPTARCSSC